MNRSCAILPIQHNKGFNEQTKPKALRKNIDGFKTRFPRRMHRFYNMDKDIVSGKPQNQLTLTNGKYFALSWLCSECNDPLCCDPNNQNACSQLKSTSLQLNDNRHDYKTTGTINEIGNIQVSSIVTDTIEQPLRRNTNDINATSASEFFSNKFKFDRRVGGRGGGGST